VFYGGAASAELYAPPVLEPAPRLFSISCDGKGQGTIWHTTGRVASEAVPAVAGDVLAMYTTSPTEAGVIPPQVAIDGRLAEVLYFGDVSGLLPVNFWVPGGVPSGVPPGPAVPVRLMYIGWSSNEVTVGVQFFEKHQGGNRSMSPKGVVPNSHFNGCSASPSA
jgi:uncharacterized protein (TIGR03437 family)